MNIRVFFSDVFSYLIDEFIPLLRKRENSVKINYQTCLYFLTVGGYTFIFLIAFEDEPYLKQ